MPKAVFDPDLSAQLHNQILEHAWIGAGLNPASLPSKTWWEESSPIPFGLASRLNPSLIRFLRSARAIIFDTTSEFHLFYYLIALNDKHGFFDQATSLKLWGDRYIWLYPSTRTMSQEEAGILFDKETELASFVPDWVDLVWSDTKRWPWLPLQDILQVYLDMINEGKITTYSDRRKELRGATGGIFDQGVFPWEIHQHTPMDVEKAVGAFTRLLDAIEIRLPSTSSIHDSGWEKSGFKGIALPYSGSVIEASFIEADSFASCFLSALPVRQLNFRYIAPGIRLQDPVELVNQPLAERRFNELIPDRFGTAKPEPCFPLLLFRGEGENKSPWSRPWFPDGNAENIPSGLYIEPADKDFPAESGNESRLLLPFSIGSNGFARSSNTIRFKRDRPSVHGPDQLYQMDNSWGYSCYFPRDSRSSYLHKVLENWAERVEMGDWLVGEEGIVGGIEKFKEADTKEHWREYVIPL